MKRVWKSIIVMLMILFFTGVLYAATGDQCIPTTVKTGDSAAVASKCMFHGIVVITDGTNAVTVKGYDNASAASGTSLFPDWVVTTSGTDRAQTLSFIPPVYCANGVYIDVTVGGGGSVSYVVYYEGLR